MTFSIKRFSFLTAAVSLLCAVSCPARAAVASSPGTGTSSPAEGIVTREQYLDIMQEAFEAYTPERLDDYIERVERDGITEHGYGRVTSNLGILIAHGRLQGYRELFVRMMDLAAREIPVAHLLHENRRHGVGNDFAIKEFCNCIEEIEKTGAFSAGKISQWKEPLSRMAPEQLYTVQPETGRPKGANWAVYGSASECARMAMGMGGDRAYPDRYLTDQLRFFDENGMWREPGFPMVYDLVTRLQFMSALDYGYDGPARRAIEENLLKGALPMLRMQSVSGEIPYGGRSNEFLHNDTFYAAVCEYYACLFKSLGDMETASRFKSAAARAVAGLGYWTSQKPVRHVKNRYPTETGYGCESYAYFDKYMITMASWAYLAFRFADDSIPAATAPEKPSTFVMSPEFHRIVMNAGGYTVQFDLKAQKSYDADGIGRFQRGGACPVVALASPCPAAPKYSLDITNEGPLAISPEWSSYDIVKARAGLVILTDSVSTWKVRLTRRGVRMVLKGPGTQHITLPVFLGDGENSSEVNCGGRTLKVAFGGSVCVWKTSGRFTRSDNTYGNRNGHLGRYDAVSPRRLVLKGKIF